MPRSNNGEATPSRLVLQGPRPLPLAALIQQGLTFQCNDTKPRSEQRDVING